MTSTSRSNRGGGGAGGGGANNARPERDQLTGAPLPMSADGLSISGQQSALVAAAVASMANTQPLALTTKNKEESDDERK